MKVGTRLKKTDINSIEVARLAGVSRSTVSRVINNYSNVPQKTKEKVMWAIKELNYYPNASAQMLAGKKSRTIGLFIVSSGEIAVDILTNMMIVSVIEAASDLNYYVLTYIIRDIDDEMTKRNVEEIFYQRRIDGGIFIGSKHNEPLVQSLLKDGFIVGVFDQERTEQYPSNAVLANLDNESGMKQAVSYLYELGHRDIGYIGGDEARLSGFKKKEGFIKALDAYGLDCKEDWMLEGNFTESAGYQAIERLLLSNNSLPTAIIAANDSIAFGAMKALTTRNISIPNDISIIGFDDHGLSEKHNPPLTTVRVDFKYLFKQLMRQVITQVETEQSENVDVYIDSTLVIRESCQAK